MKTMFSRLKSRKSSLAAAFFVMFAGVGILALSLSSAATEEPTERLIVQYKTGSDQQSLQSTYNKHRGVKNSDNTALNFSVVKVPKAEREQAIQELQQDPQVEAVRPDGILRPMMIPDDPMYTMNRTKNQWTPIQAEDYWDTDQLNTVTVAVIDSGIVFNDNSKDLNDKIQAGYDFVDKDNDPDDPGVHAHGTAVASIIAANTNNSYQIASACGSCDIMPLRVLAPDSNTYIGYVSDVADAITYAVDHNIKIINISMATEGTTEDPLLASAVAYAKSHGAQIIASSGNELIGAGGSTTRYPAANPDVLSVAATAANSLELTSWSNYGTTVDIAAIGEFVWSIQNEDGVSQAADGTSYATAVITSVFAGLRSIFPSASNDQIKSAITSSADACCGGKISGGRINAYKALLALAAAVPNDDIEKPEVWITSPAPDAVVSGPSVGVTIDASDNKTVSSVTVEIDPSPTTTKTRLTTPPYTYNLDSTKLSNGHHTIVVNAYDGVGHSSFDFINITVNNTTTTPPPTTPPPTTPPPTPPGKTGDLNGDNKVNITDLSKLLSAWGTNNATADINKSGKVDLTDLSMLLSHWTG